MGTKRRRAVCPACDRSIGIEGQAFKWHHNAEAGGSPCPGSRLAPADAARLMAEAAADMVADMTGVEREWERG